MLQTNYKDMSAECLQDKNVHVWEFPDVKTKSPLIGWWEGNSPQSSETTAATTSQSPGSMTLTTIITVTTFTSLILTVTQSEAFFLFRNNNAGAETRSTNLTQDAILGLFDTVTGLTHGIGGIFEQFEDGFERIKPKNNTILNKVYVSDEEEGDDTSLGSTAVVGLFDSLRNLNKQVGKLVGVLGHTLTDRREDVEKIATNVDTRVFYFLQDLETHLISYHSVDKLRPRSEGLEEKTIWSYSKQKD